MVTKSLQDLIQDPARNGNPWLRFILTAHVRQARTMLRRVKESERLWIELERLVAQHRLPERTIAALFDAASGLRVRNSTYRAELADSDDEVSNQTAVRDLRELVAAGLLAVRGKARGRYYVATGQLAHVRQEIINARDPRDDSDLF